MDPTTRWKTSDPTCDPTDDVTPADFLLASCKCIMKRESRIERRLRVHRWRSAARVREMRMIAIDVRFCELRDEARVGLWVVELVTCQFECAAIWARMRCLPNLE